MQIDHFIWMPKKPDLYAQKRFSGYTSDISPQLYSPLFHGDFIPTESGTSRKNEEYNTYVLLNNDKMEYVLFSNIFTKEQIVMGGKPRIYYHNHAAIIDKKHLKAKSISLLDVADKMKEYRGENGLPEELDTVIEKISIPEKSSKTTYSSELKKLMSKPAIRYYATRVISKPKSRTIMNTKDYDNRTRLKLAVCLAEFLDYELGHTAISFTTGTPKPAYHSLFNLAVINETLFPANHADEWEEIAFNKLSTMNAEIPEAEPVYSLIEKLFT